MLAITSKITKIAQPDVSGDPFSVFSTLAIATAFIPFLERQQARKKAIDWIVPNQLSIHRIAIDHHNPLTVNTTP